MGEGRGEEMGSVGICRYPGRRRRCGLSARLLARNLVAKYLFSPRLVASSCPVPAASIVIPTASAAFPSLQTPVPPFPVCCPLPAGGPTTGRTPSDRGLGEPGLQLARSPAHLQGSLRLAFLYRIGPRQPDPSFFFSPFPPLPSPTLAPHTRAPLLLSAPPTSAVRLLRV